MIVRECQLRLNQLTQIREHKFQYGKINLKKNNKKNEKLVFVYSIAKAKYIKSYYNNIINKYFTLHS